MSEENTYVEISDQLTDQLNQLDESFFDLFTSPFTQNPTLMLLAILGIYPNLDDAISESLNAFELKRSEIRLHLKRKKYKNLKKTNHACPICLDYFQPDQIISVLGCEHLFHGKCIRKWGMYNPVCPICRYGIDHSVL
jgi:hypothetical protein